MQYIYKDRIIHIEWSIFKGTSPVREDFSRALVKCFLVGPNEKYLLDATAEGGKLLMDIPQGLPEGAYSLETIYVKNWNSLLPVRDTITPSDAPVPHRVPRPGINPNDHNTIHPHDFRGNERSLMRSRVEYAFAITSYPTEADDTESSGEVTLPLKSSVASYGYDGLSAYEIAVLRGDFDGTESEWLEWTHERIVADVKNLLQQLKDRDTRFVVKTQSQRDNLPDIKDGDEVYVTDDAMGYVLKEENGERIWMPSDYGSVTAKYILSFIADMPNFVADRAIADEFGKRIVDEYLTRDAVRNYISEIYNDLFVKNPPYIMDGYITVDMLSDAVKQLIGFGPIVNFPDDEFLTTKGGRITLKDKDYNPNSYSGMGRRILRKNMVNGVNVLTQRMMLCPNTIYVISYDYDLRGQTITVPENCVLQFKGGSFSNGSITGSNTEIVASPKDMIFNNITIVGNWNTENVYDTWFSYNSTVNSNNTGVLRSILGLCNHNIQNHLHLSSRVYYVSRPDNESFIVNIPSYTRVTFDSTIVLNPTSEGKYEIFRIADSRKITISGIGTIIGDVETHTGTTGEWGNGISILNSIEVTVDGITIYNCWGDGIYIGHLEKTSTLPQKITLSSLKIGGNRRQGISVISVAYLYINNCIIQNTGTIASTAPACGLDLEPNEPSWQRMKEVHVVNCIFEGNTGGGALAHNLPKNSTVYYTGCSFLNDKVRFADCNGITFDNCVFTDLQLNSNASISNILIKNSTFTALTEELSYNYMPAITFYNCKYKRDTNYEGKFYNIVTSGKYLKLQLPPNFAGLLRLTYIGNSNTVNIKIINETIYNINVVGGTVYAKKVESKFYNIDNDLFNIASSQFTVLFSDPVITDSTCSIYICPGKKDINFSGTLDIKPIIKYQDSTIDYNNFKISYVDSTSVPDVTFPITTSKYPRDTTANLSSYTVTAGDIAYDSTLKKMKLWNGTAWVNLDGTALS